MWCAAKRQTRDDGRVDRPAQQRGQFGGVDGHRPVDRRDAASHEPCGDGGGRQETAAKLDAGSPRACDGGDNSSSVVDVIRCCGTDSHAGVEHRRAHLLSHPTQLLAASDGATVEQNVAKSVGDGLLEGTVAVRQSQSGDSALRRNDPLKNDRPVLARGQRGQQRRACRARIVRSQRCGRVGDAQFAPPCAVDGRFVGAYAHTRDRRPHLVGDEVQRTCRNDQTMNDAGRHRTGLEDERVVDAAGDRGQERAHLLVPHVSGEDDLYRRPVRFLAARLRESPAEGNDQERDGHHSGDRRGGHGLPDGGGASYSFFGPGCAVERPGRECRAQPLPPLVV